MKYIFSEGSGFLRIIFSCIYLFLREFLDISIIFLILLGFFCLLNVIIFLQVPFSFFNKFCVIGTLGCLYYTHWYMNTCAFQFIWISEWLWLMYVCDYLLEFRQLQQLIHQTWTQSLLATSTDIIGNKSLRNRPQWPLFHQPQPLLQNQGSAQVQLQR